MESEKIALFDMDGTLCDYQGELSRRLEILRSPHEPKEEWGWNNEPPYLYARMKLIKNNPGFWINLPRLDAGFEILDIIKNLEYRIEILTKGPRSSTIAWMEKVEWCQRELKDIPHQTSIVMDKGLVYGKILVDDYPEYILRWLEWRKRGKVIMPAHPYNKDFTHPQVLKYELGNKEKLIEFLK
jgi:5'-nucleotidase